MLLAKSIVWITGASSGIGEAIAKEAAQRGAKVILTARQLPVLTTLVEQIRAAGGEAYAYPGDVCNCDAMKQLAKEVELAHGAIDILIANAGTHVFTQPENFNSAEYLSLMQVNFGGILHCIESVLPQMIKRRSGHIVGMASLAGYRGLPRAAAYGASKAATIHFLESIRFHLALYQIPVSIITPGFVKTPLTDKNDFRMPFLVSANKAAQIICNGIERNKKEISFPFPFNWILKLARILPYPLYERIIFKLW